MLGRGAFQEMDYRAFFGSVAKWVTEIDNPAQIPEVVQRAFHVAMQGRPGPVVIALPEDMLVETAEVADAPKAVAAPIWPGPTQMAELQKMLWAAERPIAVLGGPGWTERASAAFARFAERFDMPVVGSFRRGERLRRRARQLCRRDRPLGQSEAEGADRERRRRDAGRRTHVGGGRPGLHAVRHSNAAPAAHPCPRGSPGNWPQLSSDARRHRHVAGILRRARRRSAARDDPVVGRDASGARRLSGLERAGAAQSRPRPIERDHVRAAPPRSRRDLRHRRRQLHDLGRTISSLSPDRAAARARPPDRWASGCLRRSAPPGSFLAGP